MIFNFVSCPFNNYLLIIYRINIHSSCVSGSFFWPVSLCLPLFLWRVFVKGLRVSDLLNLTCPDFCPETSASHSSTRENECVCVQEHWNGSPWRLLKKLASGTLWEYIFRSKSLWFPPSAVLSRSCPSFAPSNTNCTIKSNQSLFLRGDFVSARQPHKTCNALMQLNATRRHLHQTFMKTCDRSSVYSLRLADENPLKCGKL